MSHLARDTNAHCPDAAKVDLDTSSVEELFRAAMGEYRAHAADLEQWLGADPDTVLKMTKEEYWAGGPNVSPTLSAFFDRADAELAACADNARRTELLRMREDMLSLMADVMDLYGQMKQVITCLLAKPTPSDSDLGGRYAHWMQ